MRKMVILAAVLAMTGCATSTQIGNMQNDCDPGFLSPSVCLVTAKVDNKETVQFPVAGMSFLGIAAPAAASVGSAALIGNGLAHSGSHVSSNTNNVNQSAGGKATGGQGGASSAVGGSSSANAQGGSSASSATGGSNTTNVVANGGQGGAGGSSVSNSESGALAGAFSSSNASNNIHNTVNNTVNDTVNTTVVPSVAPSAPASEHHEK